MKGSSQNSVILFTGVTEGPAAPLRVGLFLWDFFQRLRTPARASKASFVPMIPFINGAPFGPPASVIPYIS